MSESHKLFSSYARVLLAGALLFAFACSTDSPTEPRQNPQPPGGQPPSDSFVITLTASAPQVELGGNEAVTITVSVRQASNNQPPPDGTTVSLSTTLGSFNAPGSGQQTGFVELVGGVAQLLLFPGDIEGTAVVTAQLQDSVARVNVTFVGAATFFLQSLSPTIGTPAGGDVVRITGGGFFEPVRVLFGGVPAQVLSVGPDAIRVRTPAIDLPVGSSQRVGVTVTVGLNTEDEQTDTLASAFTYTRGGTPTEPVIFSVTPNAGPNEGGTRVVIEGEGFESPVQVLFGSGASPATFSGVEAVVESVTGNRIVAIAPTATGFGQINLNALVDILVRNRNSGDTAIFSSAFRYGVEILITSIAPGEGPFTGGQLVTLFGQGFDEPVAVELAGVGQSVISVTGTEIIVRTVAVDPASCSDSAVSGDTRVTNIETGATATGPNYIYRVVPFRPRVTSITPNSGSGGGIATIGGSNFTADTEVQFAIESGSELAATIQNVTPSTLTVVVPTPQLSDFEVEACDDNDDGTSGERYIATVADIVVTDVLNTCSSTFAGGFTFLPTDTSCRNDVGPVEPVDPPTAAFSAQNLDASTFTVQFIDESTGDIASYLWTFGDGSPASATANPVHTFPAAGNYSVSLTVGNAGGTDTAVQVITVPIP
ncbi:MAG TPA: IPT/TIG domain-containing protein [Thermoanaerobaculia bacterium]|nr:IPT/TIG domain-containing protein [Thermoanaerobaculia bacterium]